mmetsp:Transcript_945/g.2095  ORF Transcript_945/g.2095 Transcript_945/m.2095 type:complete len:206 (-) Transcript_945:1569-2186(-)
MDVERDWAPRLPKALASSARTEDVTPPLFMVTPMLMLDPAAPSAKPLIWAMETELPPAAVCASMAYSPSESVPPIAMMPPPVEVPVKVPAAKEGSSPNALAPDPGVIATSSKTLVKPPRAPASVCPVASAAPMAAVGVDSAAPVAPALASKPTAVTSESGAGGKVVPERASTRAPNWSFPPMFDVADPLARGATPLSMRVLISVL